MHGISSIDYDGLRNNVRALCRRFPNSYWRELDKARAYPEAFVNALTESGYLAALIPQSYGGLGLGVTEASIILEEIHRCASRPSVWLSPRLMLPHTA
jgi:acyl-CoA dehydrogenase